MAKKTGTEKPSKKKREKSKSAETISLRFMKKQKKKRGSAPRETPVDDSSTEPADVINLAISVRQPYAEQILRGARKFEYRSRPIRIRARVYVYASRTPARYGFEAMDEKPGVFPTGLLVGTVEIVDCIRGDEDFAWRLARPERLAQPLRPQRRAQPFWFIPFVEESPDQASG